MTSATQQVDAWRSSAATRIAMSRSVNVPSTFPDSSQIGRNPMFASRIRQAATCTLSFGARQTTSFFMTSAHLMTSPPIAVPGLPSSMAATADRRPSRLRARSVARPRRGDGALGFRRPCPTAYACAAERRVRALAAPRPGGFRGTPARRALESPMAIACWGDLAPCRPRRTCSISSRTNSPAAVDGRLPRARSRFALRTVRLLGMTKTWDRALVVQVPQSPGRRIRVHLTSRIGREWDLRGEAVFADRDRAVELRARFIGQHLRRGVVTRREVGEQELSRAGTDRHTRRFRRGAVPGFDRARLFRVGEGAVVNQQVRARSGLRQRDAGPRVAGTRQLPSPTGGPEHVVRMDRSPIGQGDLLAGLKPAVKWTFGDSQLTRVADLELPWSHGLFEHIPERRHAVIDADRANRVAVALNPIVAGEASIVQWEGQASASKSDQRRELVVDERPRPVQAERVGAAAHRHGPKRSEEAEIMIAVKVRKQHEIEVEACAKPQHLPLGSLPAVDEKVISMSAHRHGAQAATQGRLG